MQDDVIFIRQGTDLVALASAPYEAEAVLQELLEHHPQLLAGYQMSRGDPRRFLLIRREAPIADHEGGASRWSVDHLFVDQDAVPTLVEVKRSSDARIRREVVGQMACIRCLNCDRMTSSTSGRLWLARSVAVPPGSVLMFTILAARFGG